MVLARVLTAPPGGVGTLIIAPQRCWQALTEMSSRPSKVEPWGFQESVKGVEGCRCGVKGVSKCVSMDTGVDGVEGCRTSVEALDTNSTRLDVLPVSKCPQCRVSPHRAVSYREGPQNEPKMRRKRLKTFMNGCFSAV